ncbi:zinc-binding dehydrogenase [Salinibacterium sp. M195]|uniref:zinc-binding dehydrogenase n=1 Tax=Salinibacterium sp. M195 TaxID=2583374 RepID=UPI001C63A11A|nr:zinc-binding dehydrogenase [Salinibacterium sp. M195]QYH35464.1 zinc-binding dehydrogenase [Salinibacterium sp. M195]
MSKANSRGIVAYMEAPGVLRLALATVPEPESGGIVMRNSLANVCGSELHIWAGKHPVKKRGGLGHEVVGTIERLGDDVTMDNRGQPLAVGDRIVATYFQTCHRCFHCLEGEYNLCDNAYEFFSKQPEEAPHFHAAFSTHSYIHPRQHVYRVPDGLSDEIVVGANCALSQVMYGLDQINPGAGQTIVVQGAGGLGLYAVAVAKERGARVIVVDSVAARLEQAQAFGADAIVDISQHPQLDERVRIIRELTDGRGADAAVEVAGIPAAFAEGLQLLRRGGRYLVMGNLSPGVSIDYDPGLITRKALTIVHVDRYDGRYLWKALCFLERNAARLPLDRLSATVFGLENVQDALDRSLDRSVTRASIDMRSIDAMLEQLESDPDTQVLESGAPQNEKTES